MPEGFPFNLSSWLQIDAYTRIGVIVLLLIVGIFACCNLFLGIVLLGIAICLIIVYTLFSIAWTVIGAIMFWGRLNPAGACHGGVQIYLWIFLILSFVGVCFNCISGLYHSKTLRA